MKNSFDLNFMEMFMDLGNICKTEHICEMCASKGCLVGYAKECVAECRINDTRFVQDGFDNIPPEDIRGGYDEFEVLHAIAHLLLQCHSCKDDHVENCIINIMRSCLEIIEFGEEKIYEGNPLSYMLKIREINSEKADVIAEEYCSAKEKKFIQNLNNEKISKN